MAAALRLSAANLYRNQSAIGAFYRRMIAKLGKASAVTATAHKLARLIYHMIKHGTEYVDKGVKHYEEQYKKRMQKNLEKRASTLGFLLVKKEEIQNGITCCNNSV